MDSRIYWDANDFISRFNRDVDRIAVLEAIIDSAELGEVKIATSTISLVEVNKIKLDPGMPAIPFEEQERMIVDFFDNPYIVLVGFDQAVAASARKIMRDYPSVKPEDATHIASAIRARCDVLHTYDTGMHKATGRYGEPALRIEKPA